MLLAPHPLVSGQDLVPANLRWQASFPGNPASSVIESTAVPFGDGELVAIVLPGAEPRQPSLKVGQRVVKARLSGHDPVSRLGFFEVEGTDAPSPLTWLEQVGPNAEASCRAVGSAGFIPCQTRGWIKQVRGKVLPLALLRVDFSGRIPSPGTPVLDAQGRVFALVFQEADTEKSAYAIPCEAVHRVYRDIRRTGRLQRGFLGLALRAESPSPQVVRVLPDSPATRAGIRPADQLVKVGVHPVASYADAANAFFYLVPGQPVKVELLRNGSPLSFTLTPTASPTQ
jgi:hypothetical protein